MKSNYEKLAVYMKNARTAAGLTQIDVAEKLGYTSPQFISNWERGLSAPPLKDLNKLAHLYDVSLNEFFELLLEVCVAQYEHSLRQRFQKVKKNKVS